MPVMNVMSVAPLVARSIALLIRADAMNPETTGTDHNCLIMVLRKSGRRRAFGFELPVASLKRL